MTTSRWRSGNRFRTVYVHQYKRRRFGKWEDVCAHYRSHPGQLKFDF